MRRIAVILIFTLIITMMPSPKSITYSYASNTENVSSEVSYESSDTYVKTDDEIETLFSWLDLVINHMGKSEFSGQQCVPPKTIYYWLGARGILADYFDEQKECVYISFEEYIGLVEETFLNYDEEEILQYFISAGLYEEQSGMLTLGNGHGGSGARILLNVESSGDFYYLYGLSCTWAGENEESILPEMDELYDYFVFPNSETNKKWLISDSVKFTLMDTDTGFKIVSFERLPYYEYEGSYYYRNLSTGAFDQRFDVSLADSSYEYTGKQIIPKPIIVDKNGDVLSDNEYNVGAVTDCTNVGNHTIEISFDGNYSGFQTLDFEIIPATKKDIAECDIGKIESQKCTGSIICPIVVVNDGNTLLEENVDYTISYRRNLLPGTAYVEIDGIGNYQGKVTKEFVIEMPSIDNADSFSKEMWECIFYKLGMTVMYGDTNDIDATFTENDVPSAELSFWWLVRSGQIYNGMTFDEYMKIVNQDFLHADSSESKDFLIKRGWYNEDTSTLNMELYGWGGPYAWKLLNVEKKESTYSLKGLSMFTIASDDKEEFYDYFKCPLWADFGTDNYNNCLISNSIEFTIKETKDGYKIASYQILPTYEYDSTTYFKNQTTGKFDQSFTATKEKESYVYTGDQIVPEIIVTGRNSETISKDSYTVEPVTDCRSVGAHTVSIVFNGNYEGKIDLSYEITECKHSWQEATCTTAKKCKVCGTTSGSALGHSYSSTYTVDKKATTSADGSKSKHCTRSGCTAKSSVTAIPKVSTVKLSTSTYTYSGGVKSPSVTVKDSNGNKLVKDTDYTLSTPSGRKNAGTYTYKVTFKGKYSGTKELKLTIKPKKIDKLTLSKTTYVYDGNAKKPTVTVKAGTLSAASKVTKSNSNVTITYANGRTKVGTYKVTVKGKGNYTGTLTKTFKINPKATKITSLTKGKKSFTVKWSKKTTQTTGYQIYYTTSKTRTNGKQITISKNTTTKKTISKLKSGKKYYVWVRTYKTVDGKKYYSSWSSRKYVTTK